jgi:uncharacterized membrane protein YccC
MIFKNWAFKLFIYTLILNFIVIFLHHPTQLFLFGLLATCILIIGVVFGIISFVKKEQRDYKKLIGLFGNLALLIFSTVYTFLENA